MKATINRPGNYLVNVGGKQEQLQLKQGDVVGTNSSATEAKDIPKRIQRKRTKGWRMPSNTVYVGRPSKWGNEQEWQSLVYDGKDWLSEDQIATMTPKQLKKRAISLAKSTAAALYEIHLTEADKEEIRKELKGKNLACWCSLEDDCHADVLFKIANTNS